MNCHTAREMLELARPGDPDAQTVNEAARHVMSCPACDAAVRHREALDIRIGELCRNVSIPARLKDRLLAALDSSSATGTGPARMVLDGTAAGSSGISLSNPGPAEPPPSRAVPAEPVVGSRRRWLSRISTAAACIAAVGLGIWSLFPAPPSIGLDEIVDRATSNDIDPKTLAAFTRFRNGLAVEAPGSMMTRWLVDPPRRLGDSGIAVFFFEVPRPDGATLKGRLLIVPKSFVKAGDVPTAARFLSGPTQYIRGFQTTAWVEGKFVYVCCLAENASGLRLLQPAAPQPV